MNNFKKLIGLISISAMLSTSVGVLNAEPDSGYAYDSTVQAPSVSTTAVIAGVAAVALIAIFAQPHHKSGRSNSSHYSGHLN